MRLMKKIIIAISIFAGLMVTSSCDLKEDSSMRNI